MAERIQRKRTKGWRMPENTVYVGRPGPWGNPISVGAARGHTAEGAVSDYRRWMARDASLVKKYGEPPTRGELNHLVGKNLACWCRLDQPCHADALLDLVGPATGGSK